MFIYGESYFLIMFSSKNRLKIYLLRLSHGTYHLVKVKKIKETKQLISYKNREYKLDLKTPCYVSGSNILYFIDIDSGDQLTFNLIKSDVNPEDLDIIVGQKIIRELTRGVLDNRSQYIFYAIIGFVIGALMVGVIMSMYYSDKINSIYSEQLLGSDTPSEIIPMVSKLSKIGRKVF